MDFFRTGRKYRMKQRIDKKTYHVKLSDISVMHYIKLVFRSILFLAAVAAYVYGRVNHSQHYFCGVENDPVVLSVIWLVFVVEMVFRFFPSKLESMGCQKQFARNYQPTGHTAPQEGTKLRWIILAWISLNAGIGALYLTHLINEGIMLLVALAYSVCDIICILFFCPFQTWFMKNKCCGSCRIYNWDYAMMFTPLIFVKSAYTWSILALALGLLLRWEITAYRHPERFYEISNAGLSCKNCPEKLCHHKKQLQQFLRNNRHLLSLSNNPIFTDVKYHKGAKEKRHGL